MCNYCENLEPIIRTDETRTHFINVSIYKNVLVGESIYKGDYAKETLQKGTEINFCPMCGKKLVKG